MTDDVIIVRDDEGAVYRIAEGDGSNLDSYDEEEGYVDYIMLDLYSSYEDYEQDKSIDGAQVLLRELYQEKFDTPNEVVDYLWDTGWLFGNFGKDYELMEVIY